MNTSSSTVEPEDESCSCSSSSFTSYATLPNVDYENSDVAMGCVQKLIVKDCVSLENNAASTASLAGVAYSPSFSSSSNCEREEDGADEDCGRDSWMEDNKSTWSDYSMEDCDLTIADDKPSLPMNEAEVMFLQVVEILRFEKKVNVRQVHSTLAVRCKYLITGNKLNTFVVIPFSADSKNGPVALFRVITLHRFNTPRPFL